MLNVLGKAEGLKNQLFELSVQIFISAESADYLARPVAEEQHVQTDPCQQEIRPELPSRENPPALSCHIMATWLLWFCFLSWNLSLRFSGESEDHHQVPQEFSTKAPLLCFLKNSATATWTVPTLEQENGV